MSAYIKHISYYLPEKKLTNKELVEIFPDWSINKIANKVGILERRVAGDNETASDLAVKAAVKLIEENKISKSSIDYLLFVTSSPDYYLPTTACILQHRLGLPTGIGAVDVNQGCSGYIYGLSLAKGLIAGKMANNILLLTSETYTKYIHPKDKGNRTIFGDAASASLISSEGSFKIKKFSFGTDGRGADNLIVRTGGSRIKKMLNDLTYDEYGTPKSSDHLYMDGREILNYTLDYFPPLVDDILRKNKLSKENIDLYVLHQANKYIMELLRRKMNIPEDIFFKYYEYIGNTVSSTIPIALKEAWEAGKVSNIENILIAAPGLGYSWGGTILDYKPLKKEIRKQ